MPTRGFSNGGNALGVVINEIMYHPDDGTTVNEYLELYNPSPLPVELWNAAGEWRIDGGVSYTFPPGTSIPGGGCLLLVPFDPNDTIAMNAFLAAHGVASIASQVLGPYTGSLSNRVERVSLERPQPPDEVGGNVSWVIADEVIYFEQAPFPAAADGGGPSLHRIAAMQSGNDPANWLALPATPGAMDDVLVVVNLQTTDITPTAATLSGEVLSTTGEDPVVHIYWGTADEGTNGPGWEHDVNLGVRGVGSFSTAIAGLTPGATYYFRCFAETSTDSVWANETASFTTGVNNYTLTVSAVNGVVVKNPDQFQYVEGTQVTLTPLPQAGYLFDGWTGDVPPGHENDTPLVLTMDGNKTLSAQFRASGGPSSVRDHWILY
jgi:hypothetical protein